MLCQNVHYDCSQCDLLVRFTSSNLLSGYFWRGGRVRKRLFTDAMLTANACDSESRNTGLLHSGVLPRKCQA